MYNKFEVSRTFVFDAAHHLPDYKGPCANVHGHRYELTATFFKKKGDDGIAMDFRELKRIVQPVIDAYDHQNLNDYFEMPTAENILEVIWKALEHYEDLHALELKEGRDTKVTLRRPYEIV